MRRFGNFGAARCGELEQEFLKSQVATFAPTCKMPKVPTPMPAHICNPALIKRFNLLAKGLDECKKKTDSEYAASHSKKASGKKVLWIGVGVASIIGLIVLIKIL